MWSLLQLFLRNKYYTELILTTTFTFPFVIFSSIFLILWVTMEIILFIIVYWGVRDTRKQVIVESVSVFFVYKTLRGIFICVGALCSFHYMLMLGIIVSTNLLPFVSWFIRSFFFLPLYLIVFVGMYLKIIPLYIINRLSEFFIIILGVLSLITSVSGVIIMFNSYNLVTLLVSRRVYNRHMFIIGRALFHPFVFVLFYYLFSLVFVTTKSNISLWLLSGLPPSPLFFIKMYIILLINEINLCLAVLVTVTFFLSYFTYLKYIVLTILT